jgi:hypothetical protein
LAEIASDIEFALSSNISIEKVKILLQAVNAILTTARKEHEIKLSRPQQCDCDASICMRLIDKLLAANPNMNINEAYNTSLKLNSRNDNNDNNDNNDRNDNNDYNIEKKSDDDLN